MTKKSKPLPKTEDGVLNTSASFGTSYMVKVEYNTEFDGSPVPFDSENLPCTFHGPMTKEEAIRWVEDYPDFDDAIRLSILRSLIDYFGETSQ